MFPNKYLNEAIKKSVPPPLPNGMLKLPCFLNGVCRAATSCLWISLWLMTVDKAFKLQF